MIEGNNPCGAPVKVNTGIVPYDGVIQYDSALKLKTPFPKISLPSLRILEAMQEYGYYVVDYGCTDLDVYANLNESELKAFGGSYNLQNEMIAILNQVNLYVVPPMVKYPNDSSFSSIQINSRKVKCENNPSKSKPNFTSSILLNGQSRRQQNQNKRVRFVSFS